MRLQDLERKLGHVAKLLGKHNLKIDSLGRKYRVEDHTNGERVLFGTGYLPAKDLWDRLDVAEEALQMLLDQLRHLIKHR